MARDKGLTVKGKNTNKTIRMEKADNGYIVSSFNDFPGDGKEKKGITEDIKGVRDTVTEVLK